MEFTHLKVEKTYERTIKKAGGGYKKRNIVRLGGVSDDHKVTVEIRKNKEGEWVLDLILVTLEEGRSCPACHVIHRSGKVCYQSGPDLEGEDYLPTILNHPGVRLKLLASE